MDNPRIALGLITRRLNNPAPILRFVNNARQHGHPVDRVIVAHSHGVDEETVESLRREIRVDVLCAHDDLNLRARMLSAGLDRDAVENLLEVPSWSRQREVPYGAYRNAVLFQALLARLDHLIYFDSDVYPRVLTGYQDGQPVWQEIDFLGAHMAQLALPDVTATSSDYSGYYIIPPMRFDGLAQLLLGLAKDAAFSYLADCASHGCLNFGPRYPAAPTPTAKLLGGNLGLSLDAPRRLAPFFSTAYAFSGQCLLGRGEDTLLGQSIASANAVALDIDLRIFHDTYGDFPKVPDIHQKVVRNRFYRACLGWIGRNPFLFWQRARNGRLDGSFEAEMADQRHALEVGGRKAARHLDDPRFERLPAALDFSLVALPETVHRYQRLLDGWHALLDVLAPEMRQAPSGREGDEVSLVA